MKCCKCGDKITEENDSNVPIVSLSKDSEQLVICKECVESVPENIDI